MSRSERILVFLRLTISILALLVTLISFLHLKSPVRASEFWDPQAIKSGRPLYNVADLLEEMYAKPVTYEDPILIWNGDMAAQPPYPGLYPKTRSFVPPSVMQPKAMLNLDALLIGKVLEEYDRQIDGPRFRVATSRWGLHILPSKVRDAEGRLVQSTLPLDAHISVPIANRTASEHFELLCDAVSNSAWMKVKPLSRNLDVYFAPDGMVPPNLPPKAMADKDRQLASFQWGATDTVARAALISLLEFSATTLSWRLYCNPEPWDQYCILILSPILVKIRGTDGNFVRKPLMYDRCQKCPPLPK